MYITNNNKTVLHIISILTSTTNMTTDFRSHYILIKDELLIMLVKILHALSRFVTLNN